MKRSLDDLEQDDVSEAAPSALWGEPSVASVLLAPPSCAAPHVGLHEPRAAASSCCMALPTHSIGAEATATAAPPERQQLRPPPLTWGPPPLDTIDDCMDESAVVSTSSAQPQNPHAALRLVPRVLLRAPGQRTPQPVHELFW